MCKKKRVIVGVLLASCVIVSLVAAQTLAGGQEVPKNVATDKSGTANWRDSFTSVDPYKIIAKQDLQKIAAIVAQIRKYYIRPVSNEELFDNAINGMLYGLDPHSEYLRAEDLNAMEMMTIGSFGGIGIEVMPYQGLLKVITPIDGSPAAKAGVKAGDVILQINRKLVKGLSLHDAYKMMRGPEGTNVTLVVERKSISTPIVINITRKIVKVKAVKAQLFDRRFAYLRIANFQESTHDEIVRAVAQLKKEAAGKLSGVVLDLRNNPGGLFEAGIQIADDFLNISRNASNNVIVYTRGGEKDFAVIARDTPGELLPQVPLVVLINEGTSSAAEIVAGALQDHKRAVVVGTKSFGKGTVQTLFMLDKNSAVKLTTALYYTPLGRSIQAKGIEPDIVIDNLKIAKKDIMDNSIGAPHIEEASLIDHVHGADDTANISENAPDKKNVDSFLKQNSVQIDDKAERARAIGKKENTELYATGGANIGTNANTRTPFPGLQSHVDLLTKDYQLYEAFNILEVLAVTSKRLLDN